MSMEWDNNLILKFIEAYKSEQGIWCSSHRYYKSRRHHIEAWDRIAKQLNIEVVDLKRKFKSIMASYRCVYRKKKASLKTGVIYHPIWFAYEAIEDFLNPELTRYRPSNDDHNKTNPQEIQEETIQEESDHVEYLNDDNEDEEEVYNASSPEQIIKQEPKQTPKLKQNSQQANSHTLKLSSTHRAKPRLTIRTPIRKRILKTNDSSISDTRLLEALKAFKRSDYEKIQRDECDKFGEYIAESLRKHDDRTQAMIKQAINNILFEQEMKKYNSEQYVVISHEEENPLILGDQDK